jgi:antitoxin (DNA-binding transcriptional repressor) of toxin-antitoxin stability system
MQTIKASEFKARCLALMDEVARKGEPLVITKNGRPLVELRAYRAKGETAPFGLHRGKVKIIGDILEPVEVEAWEALRDPA